MSTTKIYTNDQPAHGKTLKAISHWENANQNPNEVLLCNQLGLL